jgi:hypothetical protein
MGPYGPYSALGEAIWQLIALPFVALSHWFQFFRRLPRGQQELAKASHGAGMLALLAYGINLSGDFLLSSPICWFTAAIGAWGLGWFCLNASFAAQMIAPPDRGAIIGRALIKMVIGWALWSDTSDLVDLSGFEFIVHPVAVWCMATGGTKFLLMLWGGGRRPAYPLIGRNIRETEFDWDDYGRRQ